MQSICRSVRLEIHLFNRMVRERARERERASEREREREREVKDQLLPPLG
eukprot:COSAG03_NODE_6789_length_1005_cov_5.939294_1_plen_50_part_00